MTIHFCPTRNCPRYMACPENIPNLQARNCGAHELDDGRPQHGGTVCSRHAHILAKENRTVRYRANVYALTVKKEMRNIKPICQFFLQRIKPLMSKIDVSWFLKELSWICNYNYCQPTLEKE
jgi:hypothetical protein